MQESDKVREIVKEEIKKAKLAQSIRTFDMILPTIEKSKFSQEYAQFHIQSLLDEQSCGTCMHFLRGGESLSQCQLVIENPLPIVNNAHCRLWRSSSELEGMGIVESPIVDDYIDNTVKEVTTIES